MSIRVRTTGSEDVHDVPTTLQHYFRGMHSPVFVDQGPYRGVMSSGYAVITTEDVVTSDYKKRSAAGVIINNPFYKRETVVVPAGPMNLSLHLLIDGAQDGGGQWGTKLDGAVVPFPNSPPPHLWLTEDEKDARDAAINAAITAAYAKIAEPEMLAGATAAEAGKTVDFFVSTARRVIKIARAAKKLDFARMRKEIRWREFQDRYMELRYAVRPCIIDMVSVLKAIDAPMTHQRQTFRENRTGSVQRNDTVEGVTLWGGVVADIRRSFNYSYSIRAGVLCDVSRTRSEAFGLSRLPETAWELIPFSFICDWFANVGDTIAAHTPKAGVNVLSSWVTVRHKYVAVNDAVNVRLAPGLYGEYTTKSFSVSPISYGKTEIIVQREPSPPLRWLPVVDINLDTFKLLDLGIILRGIFSNGKP